MLLTLVIILILIWAAVVGSLYSNFLVFYQNFTETENYHKARYAAIAATERAELAIKQREPWYIWSWWWMLGENWSTGWFAGSDQIISDFSYLSNDDSSANKSTIFWDIQSRTKRIPKEDQWNIDKLLASWDSLNYNMMDYENAEIFLLYYDKSEWNPYNQGELQQSQPTTITANIRLPIFVRHSFWNLDSTDSLIPEWYGDDAIVDRQILWHISNNPFTIFATQYAYWAWSLTNRDSAIREKGLNEENWVWITYGSGQRNPIKNRNEPPTIISPIDQIISTYSHKFTDVFRFSSGTQLKFSVLNLILWWWKTAKRYPFLEYYVDFWDTIVSDKYYTIRTEWNYGDYKIDTIIYKPTIVESILKSFTTIL